ncbi:hypothetical protein G9A89_017635 [Geosiphon pyriformis]|nr:hypothetical protein G9A89_017635 [Geosiphon pyriformis]
MPRALRFENCEEESELESKKETSKKTITRPVTGTSSQSRNQETCDQEKKPDIREATFRNAQGNIISLSLRPISPPAENGDKMATLYITRLTDFSEEKEKMDVHMWLREYQSLETKPMSFAKFKNALLEYFSDPNAIIQLQNKFNTIKQSTDKTIEVIKQGYYTDFQVLNQFIRRLKSSILGKVCPAHPDSLPEAVMLARALELAEKEANYNATRNSMAAKIIAHCARTSKQKCTLNNKFKVATTPNTATLEYYQSIYTHCKQKFNISDGIEVVKKSVYQYIENCINNYLFGNYNISEFKYSFDFESETKTSNKGKQKLKQYSKTTLNTPILPKTTAKHLQTPKQGTSSKLPLTITPFPASLAQAETPNLSLNRFSRLEDYTLPRNPTRQQKTLQTSTNLLDYLAENTSKYSETLANKKNVSETIKEETAFKTAFLEQFTNNNTSITLRNHFHNIKQELSESVMTYIGKFNKLLRQICQLETNDYYSDVQILDQFIAGLKDKLIKKVHPHVPKDLNSAIQHAKRYEMAIEKTNCTKLVNLAIGETSLAAEEKIDQLTKKVENYFTNQQQQQPQRYQLLQRQNQNNFTSPSNNQSQNCHYCRIPGHWKRNCRKLQ